MKAYLFILYPSIKEKKPTAKETATFSNILLIANTKSDGHSDGHSDGQSDGHF